MVFDWLFGKDDDEEHDIDAEYEEELRDDIEDRMRDNIVEMYSPLFDQLRPFLSSSKKIKAISTGVYLYEDEGSNLKDLKKDAKRRVRLASKNLPITPKNPIFQGIINSQPQVAKGSIYAGFFDERKTCIYSNFLDKKVLNQLALFQEIYKVEFTPKDALTKELKALKELENEILSLTQILKD